VQPDTETPASHCCPLCGGGLQVHLGVTYHAETGTLISSSYAVTFSGMERNIFALLWKQRAIGPVPKERLFDHLYGGDPNGGPHDKVIEVWVCRIRKKLADAGADIDIKTTYTRGYHLKTNTPARRPRAKVAA
jgi:two-component system cell cycle response regulator CtrA